MSLNLYQKHRIYFYIVLSIFISSCGKGEKNSNTPREKIHYEVGGRKFDVPLTFSAKEQPSYERQWKQIQTDYQFTIGGIEDTVLYFPGFVENDAAENIYVLDQRGCSVKKFNKSGKYLASYGRKGKGPGEFESPFRFDVLPDGKIAVLDPNLGKCEVFDNGQNYSLSLLNQPDGICFASPDNICAFQMINPIGRSCFANYSYKTKEMIDYEKFFNEEEVDEAAGGLLPVLQGNIYNFDDDKIVYVPFYMDFFVTFTSDGKIDIVSKTIDRTGIADFKLDSFSNVNFILPEKYLSTINADVLDDQLIILSHKAEKENKEQVIDFYSLTDGKYKYSIKLTDKEKFMTLHISEDRLFYVTPKAEVKVYNYKIM